MPSALMKAGEFDLNVAGTIARHLQEDGIRIRLLRTGGDALADQSEEPGLGFEIDCGGSVWNRLEPTQVIAVLQFVVKLQKRATGSEPLEPFARMRAVFQVVYDFSDEAASIEDSAFAHFVAFYGLTHLWPYARAEFQSISARLGYPTFTLTALKLGALPSTFTLKRLDGPDDAPGGS